jgi:hypothetical protein
MEDWLKPIPPTVPKECFFGCGTVKSLVCPIDQLRDGVVERDMLNDLLAYKETRIEILQERLVKNQRRIARLEEDLDEQEYVIKKLIRFNEEDTEAFRDRIRKQGEVIVELEVFSERQSGCIKALKDLILDYEVELQDH